MSEIQYNKPNLYIVGAPKCGTSSLANWLDQHREISMCKLKEPHFWNTDMSNRNVKSLKKYLKLYSFNKSYRYYFEASPWYLYSNNALNNILEFEPNSKFIICIRNPANLTVSWFKQMVKSGAETARSLDEAWERAISNSFSKNDYRFVRDKKFLDYTYVGVLSSHIERYISLLDNKKLLILSLDDLVLEHGAPKKWDEILDFLDVSGDSNIDFYISNEAAVSRNRILARFIQFAGRCKKYLGIYRSFGLAKRNLKRVNDSDLLTEDTRGQIDKFYEEELERIKIITRRNVTL